MIKRIVSNGCSWMEGMGVTSQDGQGGRLQHRLSALFAKRYSAKDINLSLQGGSNDRILRTTIDWFTKNKTLNHNETFVLIGLTQPERTEMYYNETNSYIKIRASDMEYWKENFSENHEDMVKLCNLKFKPNITFGIRFNNFFNKQHTSYSIVHCRVFSIKSNFTS